MIDTAFDSGLIKKSHMYSASDFDYSLPQSLIAQEPPVNRGDSRLLIVPPGDAALIDAGFGDLGSRLREGDLLVINDTKVLPARLFGHKAGTGGKFELMLERILSSSRALVQLKTSKTPPSGTRLKTEKGSDLEIIGRENAFFVVEYLSGESFVDLLQREGVMPIPPYIKRDVIETDAERYQTVYASDHGAVAAPTAGLHFSARHLDALQAKGVELARVTLHVGAGTFQPLKSESLDDHQMHSEFFNVGREVVDAVRRTRRRGGRVVAVGTTVVRSLEAAAWQGDLKEASEQTRLFIRPGFRFKVIDMLITNFHLPRSTLLVLVSAFAGIERIRQTYEHAIANQYRFFSYGDAMLLEGRQSI
ncbi:tRNA preQ1(34) S-adenosylmethionine ribosyltransferase-isomerase QueA [Arenicellales bacterium nBUS_48]